MKNDDLPYSHQQIDEFSNISQFDAYFSGVIRQDSYYIGLICPDYSFNRNEIEDSFHLNDLDYTIHDSGSSINILKKIDFLN